MKYFLPLIVLAVVLQAGVSKANEPSRYAIGQEAYVINSHYLEGTDCGVSSQSYGGTYMGVGTLVTILADHRTSVGAYDEDSAIRVRVEDNTDTSIIGAPVGCEGWALYDYVDGDSAN